MPEEFYIHGQHTEVPRIRAKDAEVQLPLQGINIAEKRPPQGSVQEILLQYAQSLTSLLKANIMSLLGVDNVTGGVGGKGPKSTKKLTRTAKSRLPIRPLHFC